MTWKLVESLNSRAGGNDSFRLQVATLTACTGYWGNSMIVNRSIFQAIPGAADLVSRLGVQLSFHDGEILAFDMNRDGLSRLVIDIFPADITPDLKVRVTFKLSSIYQVSLEGWHSQNVIGDLQIHYAPEIDFAPSLRGIGQETPEHLIKIEPCAGAFGSILATVSAIEFETIAD